MVYSSKRISNDVTFSCNVKINRARSNAHFMEPMELVIDAVADAINTTDKQLADGFQVTDLFGFIPVFTEIPAIISNKQGIADAWKNRTPENLQTWVARAKEKIDLHDDATERKIEKGLAAAASIIDLIGEFKTAA